MPYSTSQSIPTVQAPPGLSPAEQQAYLNASPQQRAIYDQKIADRNSAYQSTLTSQTPYGVSSVTNGGSGSGSTSGIPGMGFLGSAPNNYNAGAGLNSSEIMAQGVYGQAAADAQKIAGGAGAPSAVITDQTVNAPGAITAQTISPTGLVSGPQADALRSQTLAQAAAAAAAPSSAAAQMTAAGGQIQNQQLAQAAMARGPDRAAMQRSAMLATGAQGMGAAATSAQLAAEENLQKQSAYTQALQGQQAANTTAQGALTQIGGLNQGANLTAQTTTGAQSLQAQTANQAAGLQAQQSTIADQQAAWNASQQAQNAYLGTANQATGTQNQAQGVAANYSAALNNTQQQQQASQTAALGSLIGGAASALSDERAKNDISPIGGGASYNDMLSRSYGISAPTSPYADLDRDSHATLGLGPTSGGYPSSPTPDFTSGLEPAYQPPAKQSSGGGGGGLGALIGGVLSLFSDERAKREAAYLGDDDVAEWAEQVPAVSFRYKPGIEDGGAAPHVGTTAQALEQSGPIGRMMVSENPDGLKQVEYGPLGLMVGKGALTKADQAMEVANAAYAMAAEKKKGPYHAPRS